MTGEHTPDRVLHVDEVRADIVEAVVRAQLSRALGGRRGMVEAAVPTITFTATYIGTKEIRLAIGLSLAAAISQTGLAGWIGA